MIKLCPLKFATPKNRVSDEIGWNCRENCAWWILKEKCCSLRLIAEDLNYIANHSKFQ